MLRHFIKSAFALSAVSVLIACKKSYVDGSPAAQKTNMTTYEYLKSKTGVFDSLVKLIDRAGIRSRIDSSGQTLFAFTNYGVSTYLSLQSIAVGRVSAEPFTTDSVNINSFKNYINGYIYKDVMLRDSVSGGAKYYYAKDSSRCYLYIGSVTGDPDFDYYFNSVSYLYFKKITGTTSGSAVQFQTTDIITNTGVVQVLPNSYTLFN